MQPTSTAHHDHASFRVHNARADIDHAEEALIAAMDRHAFPDAAKFAVRLAFEEAIVNAFHHGHKDLQTPAPVDVLYHVGPDKLEINVTDQGPGFDPAEIPDPTLDENIEKTSGRGLMLIRAFMSEVRHELGGRRMVMVYLRPAAEPAE